jgi:hypothetical protein
LAELGELIASCRPERVHEGNDPGGGQGRAHAPADPAPPNRWSRSPASR